MPNHCINELIFRDCPPEEQTKILRLMCGDGDKVDFNVLVPAPVNMWWGSVGSNHERAFKRTHLDWAREHWGTKWDAYDHHPVEATDDTLIVRFETAWRPPYPWLAAIFNTAQRSFEHNWLSEGGDLARQGRFEWRPDDELMGHQWQEEIAVDAMHRHLHKLLWGVEQFEDDAEEPPHDD